MSDPVRELQEAMRNRLLGHAPLTALLQGAHVFDEVPRGSREPYVAFAAIETRDWSVMEAKAHEHFVTIDVLTLKRSRELTQAIVNEIDVSLDRAALTLNGHVLVNLATVFWSVTRRRGQENWGAIMRFRATTEPLP